jgi:hypothetical protein
LTVKAPVSILLGPFGVRAHRGFESHDDDDQGQLKKFRESLEAKRIEIIQRARPDPG